MATSTAPAHSPLSAASTASANHPHPFVVEWRDGFKVDIPQVDHEHRHLFHLVKSLDIASIEKTIDELLDYVVIHFTHEQELMERSGYPSFDEHLRLHESFGATVAEFMGDDDQWSEDRVQKLRRFLNKWLVGHILTHDLRFGRWYLEQQSRPRQVVISPSKSAGGWLQRLFRRPLP
jgi:hemerythrin